MDKLGHFFAGWMMTDFLKPFVTTNDSLIITNVIGIYKEVCVDRLPDWWDLLAQNIGTVAYHLFHAIW